MSTTRSISMPPETDLIQNGELSLKSLIVSNRWHQTSVTWNASAKPCLFPSRLSFDGPKPDAGHFSGLRPRPGMNPCMSGNCAADDVRAIRSTPVNPRGPQRPHRPRRLRHAGLHPADRHLAVHRRLRERRHRRRPGRHRHRTARPEPRLVHVPARLVRLRSGQRRRPRRPDAVPDHRQLPERRRLVAERTGRARLQRPDRPVDRHLHLARSAHRPGPDRRLRRLPAPRDSSGVGEGYVQYTVQPKSGLTTGTTINQQASVVFDTNAPINTAASSTPSTPAPRPAASPRCRPPTSTPSFTVTWSGSDDAGGSGIATYNVYVSDDGGPFTLWQSDTTATSATYTGQAGHTYALLQRRHRQRRQRPADADRRRKRRSR